MKRCKVHYLPMFLNAFQFFCFWAVRDMWRKRICPQMAEFTLVLGVVLNVLSASWPQDKWLEYDSDCDATPPLILKFWCLLLSVQIKEMNGINSLEHWGLLALNVLLSAAGFPSCLRWVLSYYMLFELPANPICCPVEHKICWVLAKTSPLCSLQRYSYSDYIKKRKEI
jgi:hypothetical protein